VPSTIEPLSDWSSDIAGGYVAIDCTLAFKDFFLINDPLISFLTGFDHAPLVQGLTAAGQKVESPMLTGSSLRGALRSHAEKIGLTLATAHWVNDRDGFVQHRPISNPFAEPTKDDKDIAWYQKAGVEHTPQLAALCLNDQLFGSSLNGSRFWVSDARLETQHLNADSWKVQDFLAIDPFTGGGKDGAKFDAAPLVRPIFKATLTLHNPRAWELGWLTLVLRDLADGMIPIGFGKAKGYGVAELQQTNWRVGYLHATDVPFDAALLVNEQQAGVYREVSAETNGWLPPTWRSQAQTWIDQFNTQITTFPNDQAQWKPFDWDPFFDTALHALYGVTTSEVNNG
jgi:CRISPR/Cas system CSM-associated protein Csm3 (group 7 of RAMP superfamily)